MTLSRIVIVCGLLGSLVIMLLALTGCAQITYASETQMFDACMLRVANANADTIKACQEVAEKQYQAQQATIHHES